MKLSNYLTVIANLLANLAGQASHNQTGDKADYGMELDQAISSLTSGFQFDI